MWKNIFFIPEYFLTLLIIKYNNMKTFTITVEQLEVGKVYKYPNFRGGKFMFKFNGEFGERITYGFNANGKWCNELDIHKERIINDYEEATKEEWLEALKEEARKRGFLTKGTKFKSTFDDYGMIRVVDNFKGSHGYNDLNLDYIQGLRYGDGLDNKNGGCSNPCIYRDGIWAEVIKEEIPTQEEIYRVLDYLKNKNNS